MIIDQITPEMKNAFLEEIKKSRNSGKEHGFLLCLDKNGKLSISKKRCIGEECGFVITDVEEYCPDKVQGAFHTHPFYINVERFYGHKPTEKEIESSRNLYKKHFERKGISLTTPSHHDLVDTLLNRCLGEAVGTVCTGNDLDCEKVECWSVRDKIDIRDCSRAKKEHEEMIADEPKKWIETLFDKEIIYLKNNK